MGDEYIYNKEPANVLSIRFFGKEYVIAYKKLAMMRAHQAEHTLSKARRYPLPTDWGGKAPHSSHTATMIDIP
jgi:hypothetical protein